MGSLRLTLEIEKLPPLDQGYPEMKCPFFLHHNCCEKNSVKWYVACHGYVYNHQSYIEKFPKEIEKMTPLIVKNGIFKKKNQKSSISYGTFNPNIIFIHEKL